MWKIGNIEIKNQICLAPMAGVSNPSYIKICEKMGLAYAITELISAEAIVRDNQKTFNMLKGLEKLTIPYAIQLFGSNEIVLSKAAKIINEKYPKAIIDINMGCPVPKVAIKSASGSALLKDPNKIAKIVKSVVNSVDTPVTVKIRSGWDNNNINAVEVAKIIEKSGASAITIHARTRSQGYSGNADWNIIKQVKEAVNIPVIGNGDIKTCYDAQKMLMETNCDAVMIGRAMMGNPWLIKECLDYLTNKTNPSPIQIQEIIKTIKEHYKLLKENTSQKQAILEIRSHALWYLKGLPNTNNLKKQICQINDDDVLFSILDKYLKDNPNY